MQGTTIARFLRAGQPDSRTTRQHDNGQRDNRTPDIRQRTPDTSVLLVAVRCRPAVVLPCCPDVSVPWCASVPVPGALMPWCPFLLFPCAVSPFRPFRFLPLCSFELTNGEVHEKSFLTDPSRTRRRVCRRRNFVRWRSGRSVLAAPGLWETPPENATRQGSWRNVGFNCAVWCQVPPGTRPEAGQQSKILCICSAFGFPFDIKFPQHLSILFPNQIYMKRS